MDPERIGPYRIERKIGEGGMGTVYFGRHTETEVEAAVKVLPASLAREAGFIARFAREVDAMRRLSNPHVVQLFDSGVDGDTYYYAMEFVEGETLTQRLRAQKRLQWTEAIEISLQICTALKAAHDAGIVHRDLKPSNLMITADGMVKLTDFGVAQVFAGTKLTATGGIIGTAEYMSPEQAQGKRANKQSDLYSLGAVMYAMLTGRPPFSGKTTLEVIQKHKFGQYDKPSRYVPEIPHWLEEIVCQLLEKEPDKRFPDAFVVQRKLQQVLTKVSLSASSATQVANSTDGTAPTIATGVESGPGPATLMRDLVRADLEAQQAGSPISQLLDNTWVLVGLLLLIIAGGVFWFWDRDLTDAQMFAAAEASLEQPPGSEWIAAKDNYLLPLLNRDPDRWQEQVEPLLEQVEFYELEASFGLHKRGSRRKGPQSEPERMLWRAYHYQELGETAEAERILAGLSVLLADDAENEKLKEFTERLLERLQADRDDEDRYKLAEQALQRAQELEDAGKGAEARRLWSSIVDLYQSDAGAAEFVERARANLSKGVTAER